MNKAVLLFYFVSVAIFADAQVFLIQENFDGVAIPDLPNQWSTTTNFGIGFRTESSNNSNNPGASGLNNVVIRNTDSTGVYTLYSPVFSTVGMMDIAVLWSSRVSSNFLTPGSATPALEYSANSGLSWTPISFNENAANSTWGVVNDSIPIAIPSDAWGNPYVQLRWTASIVNDPSGTYRMDDVKIFGIMNPMSTLKMRVNMSNETVSTEGVFIAGDFNGWDSGSNAMTLIGGGIYEYEIEVMQNSQVTFRFYNGSSGNSEIVPTTCGVDDGNGSGLGRSVLVGINDTIYGPVCFGSCDNCIIVEPTLVNFHVQVDASQQNVSAQGIFIEGPFDNGNLGLFPMNDLGGGLYDYTTSVLEGSVVQYRFQNGIDPSGLEVVPPTCGMLNALNTYVREVFIGNTDVDIAQVCFSECSECIVVNPIQVNFHAQVDMSQQSISPQGVFIVGPFNGGAQTTLPMDDLGNGIYDFVALVEEGSVISYFFQNGLNASGAEIVPQACGQLTASGAYVREVVVGGSDINLPLLCFSSCDPCQPIQLVESIESAIRVWPNPANHSVSISFDGYTLLGQECMLMNALGQVVFQQRISSPMITLDAASLPNGVYQVICAGGSNYRHITLVVDHEVTNR
jgi:hypothetical protein